MEKIATDIYSFEKLRRGGYVYVDKTDLLRRENLSSLVEGPIKSFRLKGDRRPVTLVGINFRTAKRNIDEPAMERFSEAN